MRLLTMALFVVDLKTTSFCRWVMYLYLVKVLEPDKQVRISREAQDSCASGPLIRIWISFWVLICNTIGCFWSSTACMLRTRILKQVYLKTCKTLSLGMPTVQQRYETEIRHKAECELSVCLDFTANQSAAFPNEYDSFLERLQAPHFSSFSQSSERFESPQSIGA